MGKMQCGVFDSVGKLLRYFNTYKQAETFKVSRQRYDWSVKQIWGRIAMGKIGQIITVKEKNINTSLKELKVKVKK